MNKKTFTFAAAITAIVVSTSAFAGERPTYEANGLPVTPMQVSVLGGANVEQHVTAPATTLTAVQASVLTPRKLKTATVGETR